MRNTTALPLTEAVTEKQILGLTIFKSSSDSNALFVSLEARAASPRAASFPDLRAS